MILKGDLNLSSSQDRPLSNAQFSFFNWACRPYYCIWKERDTSKRLYKAGKKLGYEVMWYDSGSQVNLFFSRRNKRVLLRCKTKNSYDQTGKFPFMNMLSLDDMVKKIRYYIDRQFRVELTLGFGDNQSCLVVHNTMQKYRVDAVKLESVYAKYPYLRKVDF